jgi:hypothetical protein
MQRYLRKKASPGEVFIWTELMATQDFLEEVYAENAAEATKAPSALQLHEVTVAGLVDMTKKELASFAAFRLGLEFGNLETQRRAAMVVAICKKLGWEPPEEIPDMPPRLQKKQAPAAAAEPVVEPVATKPPAKVPEPPPETLLGSSVQPAIIKVGEREVQLGELVRRAYEKSGLNVAGWNALPVDERELHLQVELEDMQKQASADTPKAPVTGGVSGEGDHGDQPRSG